jgi:hypothetical protein
MHKKLKVCQFLYLVFCLWFLILYFFFLGIHILVLLVMYLSTDFVLLSFAAI